MRLARNITIFCIVLLPMMFIAPSTARGAECLRPNEVAISPDQREAATRAGIPADYPCWIPGQPYVGQNVGEAKQYLRTILCKPDGDNYGGAGPDRTVQELNPEFAVCAAQFIKFANETLNVPTCLKEGFRTVQKQNEYVARGAFACKVGARCEHPSGIAIDVNTTSRAGYARLHQNACQFGLDFYLRFDDQYHFVPLSHSISRRKSSCGKQVVVSCQTAGFAPQDMGYGSIPPASPTAQFTQSIRDWFSPPAQQPQMSAQPALLSPSVSPSQSPLSAFQETTPIELGGVSSQIGNTMIVMTTSTAADRLEELAFGPKPTTTTATSVPLVVSGANAAMLTGTQQASTSAVGGTQGIIFPSQTTFISGDLSWQNDTADASRPLSGVEAILVMIKATLMRMLQYLVPFGSGSINTYGEVRE